VTVAGEGVSQRAYLMGIVPNEFAQVAWIRPDLLPHHINVYANLLTENPMAAILSRNFEAKYNVKPGDLVSVSWASRDRSLW